MDIEELLKEHKINQTRYEKLKRYYSAKHDILNRQVQNPKKANNRIVNDYPGYITDTITGYFMGQPIRYTSKDDNKTYMDKLTDINEANNEQDHNAEMAKNMSIYGEAYELLYIDDEANIRFAALEPDEVIPKFKEEFGNTLEYAARLYEKKLRDKCIQKLEVYYKDHIEYYEKDGTIIKLMEIRPHYFGRVPIIYYVNNNERMGDFEKVISLIDEYDKRSSDNSNELENTRNAYLKLKNMAGTDDDDLKKCDESGVFKLEEDQDIDYLIKQINDTYIQNNLTNTDNNIHKFSKVPNLSDESFAGNLSGVAIAFKLWPLEQVAVIKERKFKTGLKRRLKLITTILNLTGGNFDYQDISVKFVRNIPQNVVELVEISSKLIGMIDDESALALLPFVDDPAATIAKRDAQEQGIGYKNFEEQTEVK